jgi:cell division protein FtsX
MRTSPRPWRRLFPASAGLFSLTLLIAGWGVVGLALWTREAINPILLAQRPKIFLEVFISDSATSAQIEELSRQIQAQPFCCGTAFISAEDARLRAARNPRVRRLLEAYGGNPLPRIVRLELCPRDASGCKEAMAWLLSLPGVTGARAPEAFLGGLLAGERLVIRLTGAGAVFLGLLGLLAAIAALWLLAREAGPEIAAMERCGAAPGMVFTRLVWTLFVPSACAAVLVFVVLRLSGILLAFFMPWLKDLGGTGFWMAYLPAFSGQGGTALLGTALIAAAFLVLRSFSGRILKKPS